MKEVDLMHSFDRSAFVNILVIFARSMKDAKNRVKKSWSRKDAGWHLFYLDCRLRATLIINM